MTRSEEKVSFVTIAVKELWAQRGLRDSERENAQAKIAAELDKVK
jgi:hypothetical protein